MTRHLHLELESLRKRLSRQGLAVTRQLNDSLGAILTSEPQKARRVMEADSAIDGEEVAIEEECLKVIALHQPVSRDLRLLVTVLKVNNDLERIADHAVNLAHLALKFADKGAGNFPPEIVRMSRLVIEACHAGVEAFVKEDIDTALSICHDDQAINELCGLVYDEAKRIQGEGRGSFGHAIRIYRVGRELERVGDLLKNIAEDTIYLITGEVVRHNRIRLLDIEAARTEG
jgi:phosphate transport system protein